jgi:hypothetical protein
MTRLVTRTGESVVLIEEKSDGLFLYEFRSDGFVGDTWHQTIDHAKEQAAHDFDNAITLD